MVSRNSAPRMNATPLTLKRAAVLTAACLVVLFGAIRPQTAFAYVLKGPHVLQLVAKAIGRLPPLKIEQKLLIYPQTKDSFPTAMDETVIYVMPRRFRSDIVSDRINRTYLEVGDQSLTVVDGRLAMVQDPFDRYQGLLRSRTRTQLMKTLSALGVETAISSLGRIDETVVFVIGAHYPDESVSQLAVDKETFLPLRLLLTDAERDDPGQRLEIYYHNWQKVQDGWFPTQIVFFIGGNLAREIRVVQMRVNPSIPADLMDLEALSASVAATRADTVQDEKQETVEAIQQGVQDFQKKFD